MTAVIDWFSKDALRGPCSRSQAIAQGLVAVNPPTPNRGTMQCLRDCAAYARCEKSVLSPSKQETALFGVRSQSGKLLRTRCLLEIFGFLAAQTLVLDTQRVS